MDTTDDFDQFWKDPLPLDPLVPVPAKLALTLPGLPPQAARTPAPRTTPTPASDAAEPRVVLAEWARAGKVFGKVAGYQVALRKDSRLMDIPSRRMPQIKDGRILIEPAFFSANTTKAALWCGEHLGVTTPSKAMKMAVRLQNIAGTMLQQVLKEAARRLG